MKHLISAAAFIALGLAACVTSNNEPGGTSQQHYEFWQAHKPADYSYTYGRWCFCPQEYTGPFRVTVSGNSVTRVMRAAYQADSVPVTTGLQGYSLDSIFAGLNEALGRQHDSAKVTYDAALGFPVQAYIDFERNAADEEYGFSITDFTPTR